MRQVLYYHRQRDGSRPKVRSSLQPGPSAGGPDSRGDGHRVRAPVAHASAAASAGDELGLGHPFAHGGGGREAAGGRVDLWRAMYEQRNTAV